MIKPNFVCGPYNVSPEHPYDWDVAQKSSIASDDTLGGTTVKDVSWRKYVFTLVWQAMSLSDYEDMEDLINYHNDSGTPIQFVYEKFRESSTIRLVDTPPLPRKRRGGSGKTNYYQGVTIQLTEVNPR